MESEMPVRQKKQKKNSKFVKFLRVVLIAGLSFFLLAAFAFLIWYMNVAQSLPDVNDLQEKASQFETTQILDREGNLLYELIDPNGGRRDYVKIEDISPYMLAATIAVEDKDFYSHPGFDIFAILRAVLQNTRSGGTVSGASTITQQLARNVLLSPEERYERSILRKTKEIFLAAEITRRYSKDEILELYLNENYYSNYAYGIEAAAKTYFGIPAKYLDFAQSAFLAGLPQAPAIYDVYTNYNPTFARFKSVLLLTYLRSQEEHCIYVGNADNRVCIDETMVDRAINEIETYDFEQVSFVMKYPHWVQYIQTLLDEEFGAQAIYRSGFTVYTSIDPRLQDLAQQVISDQMSALAENNAHNAALVALKPGTGEILAMIGSPDFDDEAHGGQINMATSPRQPGSAIKPLVYAAAFEKGWTPATLLWDVPTEFSPTGRPEDLAYVPAYVPVNYDGKFHGPVLLRDALANSYNIPAVKALEFVGLADDPATAELDGFITFAERMGITTLNRADYGLSLALGGGDATLLEMTAAFGTFANLGNAIPLTPILKILNNRGEVIFEAADPLPEPVLRDAYAYQITSILSDAQARTPMFGADSVLNQPFAAAVKTGTTNDFRDNWTIGYTPDLAVGVWVGNADYQPMIETTGVSGAAPAWSAFIRQAEPIVSDGAPSSFQRPAGMIDRTICAVSGTEPSAYCPAIKSEVFAADQPPLPQTADIWQLTRINTWTGKLANEYCSAFAEQQMTANVQDVWAQRWIQTTVEGTAWAQRMNLISAGKPILFTPTERCEPGSADPAIQFSNLTDGMEITSPTVEIYGVVNASDGLNAFSVDFGKGENPADWYVIAPASSRSVYTPEKLGDWHLQGFENGVYTLRIYAISTIGTTAEKRVTVRVNLPAQTGVLRSEPELIPVYGTEEVPQFFMP